VSKQGVSLFSSDEQMFQLGHSYLDTD